MRRFSTASEVKGTMYMNTRYIQVTYTEMYLQKKRRYFIDAHLRDMARTSYFTVVRTASSIVWFEICC